MFATSNRLLIVQIIKLAINQMAGGHSRIDQFDILILYPNGKKTYVKGYEIGL